MKKKNIALLLQIPFLLFALLVIYIAIFEERSIVSAIVAGTVALYIWGYIWGIVIFYKNSSS